jgi:hypothetical protein
MQPWMPAETWNQEERPEGVLVRRPATPPVLLPHSLLFLLPSDPLGTVKEEEEAMANAGGEGEWLKVRAVVEAQDARPIQGQLLPGPGLL